MERKTFIQKVIAAGLTVLWLPQLWLGRERAQVSVKTPRGNTPLTPLNAVKEPRSVVRLWS